MNGYQLFGYQPYPPRMSVTFNIQPGVPVYALGGFTQYVPTPMVVERNYCQPTLLAYQVPTPVAAERNYCQPTLLAYRAPTPQVQMKPLSSFGSNQCACGYKIENVRCDDGVFRDRCTRYMDPPGSCRSR